MSNTATTYVKSKRRVGRKSSQTSRRRTLQNGAPSNSFRLSNWMAGDISEVQTLPEWQDLSGRQKNRKNGAHASGQSVSEARQISTGTFALIVSAVVLLLGMYVSHVYATQETLARLEQLQRDNLRLQLEYNQKKATFDRLVSPLEIYRRARELGLKEGTQFGPTIEWVKPDEQ